MQVHMKSQAGMIILLVAFAFVGLGDAMQYDEAGENDPSSAFSALRALSGTGVVRTRPADDGVVMVMRRKRNNARLDDGISANTPSPSPSAQPSPSSSPAPSAAPSSSAAPIMIAKASVPHKEEEEEQPHHLMMSRHKQQRQEKHLLGEDDDRQDQDQGEAATSGAAADALQGDEDQQRKEKEEEDSSAPIAQAEDVVDPGIDDATSIKNDDEIYKEAVEAEAVAPVLIFI